MSAIKLAATAILSREVNGELEVYLALRAAELKFFGGYWVFPGGNLNKAIDCPEPSENPETGLKACVIREVFEEINILSSSLGKEFSSTEKQQLKGLLNNKPQEWQQFLAEFKHSFEHIDPVFRITTPPFFPMRFDTQFMHIHLRDNEIPEIDHYELVDGCFIKPQVAVDAWRRGEMQIAPPVLFLLELLACHGLAGFKQHAQQASRALVSGRLHRVFFSPGIFMAPLLSPTLPPAITTNTLIVGHDTLYVIDPATPDASEQQRLFTEMDNLLAAGRQFAAILLTHHHIDHVGAVNAVSQRYQLAVRAHEECYRRIADGYIRGKSLEDGERLELGRAPDGSDDWHLRVLHTPGHAVDHLCFLESRYHAAIVGDMLSTISSILIDPPEGHMRTYINSLQKLLSYPLQTLYPAHGPASRDGSSLIRQYLQHRQERENAVLKALTAQAHNIDALLPLVYDDVPAASYAIASRSLLASLIKLEEDAVCTRENDGWKLA